MVSRSDFSSRPAFLSNPSLNDPFPTFKTRPFPKYIRPPPTPTTHESNCYRTMESPPLELHCSPPNPTETAADELKEVLLATAPPEDDPLWYDPFTHPEGPPPPPGVVKPRTLTHRNAAVQTEKTDYLPIVPGQCWRCGQSGHGRGSCRRPTLLFCSRCGRVGVLSRECACSRPAVHLRLGEPRRKRSRN